MFRRFFIVLVALLLVSSCKNSPKTENSWEQVYKTACTNHDYTTAVVALNHLIISDSANRKNYYDSLVIFYFRRLNNYNAAKIIIDDALELSPRNAELMAFKSTVLMNDDKIDQARELYLKAHKISGKNQYKYMYAMTYALMQNYPEYTRLSDEVLYDPKSKGEKTEVMVEGRPQEYQMVDLRAVIYSDRFKILYSSGSTDGAAMLRYLDSAVMISPEYIDAQNLRDKLVSNIKPR